MLANRDDHRVAVRDSREVVEQVYLHVRERRFDQGTIALGRADPFATIGPGQPAGDERLIVVEGGVDRDQAAAGAQVLERLAHQAAGVGILQVMEDGESQHAIEAAGQRVDGQLAGLGAQEFAPRAETTARRVEIARVLVVADVACVDRQVSEHRSGAAADVEDQCLRRRLDESFYQPPSGGLGAEDPLDGLVDRCEAEQTVYSPLDLSRRGRRGRHDGYYTGAMPLDPRAMSKDKPLVIFGTGDIARLAHYYFERDSEHDVAAFTVDARWRGGAEEFLGLPLIDFESVEERFPPSAFSMFIAVAYGKMNAVRREKYEAAHAKGYELATYLSSRATWLADTPPGDNCFILEDNTVQPFVRIGRNVTLWSGNHIGHDAVIGDHCFLASHIVVSGHTEIGEQCFIGVNATLRNSIRIAPRTLIGAGAVILDDTEEGGVYVPERARRLPNKRSDQIEL